jgi:hypothetical protein
LELAIITSPRHLPGRTTDRLVRRLDALVIARLGVRRTPPIPREGVPDDRPTPAAERQGA